ncbi:MAG: hypothetical protein MI810_03055 [Flavobacteriales bacterium]|nr:hypothetical protein [Flavobacteriales bacterium]
MKRVILIASAFTALTVSVSSCKKCQECHYDGPAGEVEIGEYCGDDLTEVEANGHTVDGTTYDVHCEEH